MDRSMDGWLDRCMNAWMNCVVTAVLVVQEMSAVHTVVLAVMIAGSICS
jgi:hypothetical protein